MIANMTIAHLSACAGVFGEEEVEAEREKVRLNMGVLKVLGEVWPAGKREFGSVGVIARGVLGLGGEEVCVGEMVVGEEVGIVLREGVELDFGQGVWGEWWSGSGGMEGVCV